LDISGCFKPLPPLLAASLYGKHSSADAPPTATRSKTKVAAVETRGSPLFHWRFPDSEYCFFGAAPGKIPPPSRAEVLAIFRWAHRISP
jgi:hypothetical protein